MDHHDQAKVWWSCPGFMGLLPDTSNCRLCMRRECRERFPPYRLKRKPLVSDPGMHHGACATRNITYLARGPWVRRTWLGAGWPSTQPAPHMHKIRTILSHPIFPLSGLSCPMRWYVTKRHPLNCWSRVISVAHISQRWFQNSLDVVRCETEMKKITFVFDIYTSAHHLHQNCVASIISNTECRSYVGYNRDFETQPRHDDVIKWKHFPRYWPFVRGIRRSPVNFPHQSQWREALMFSLICAWING